MSGYLAMFKMRLIAGMQYRAAAWAGIATQFFFGLMYLMILQAFYSSAVVAQPIAWPQLASYIWLQQAFLAIWALWAQDGELLSSITNGHVAYELARPYDIYSFWIVRLAATRLSNAALRFAPIAIVSFLMPEPFRMQLPASPAAFLMFLLSLALSLAIVCAISMFIYYLTFITLTPTGARLIVGIFGDFLAGNILPVPLMPDWLQRINNFLPFRYTSDLPFRVYSGNISGAGAWFQISVQAIWIIGLAALGKLAFFRVTKRIVTQGG
jgi:ABC-2 type transport system permease protein